jgi:hypothetical protein
MSQLSLLKVTNLKFEEEFKHDLAPKKTPSQEEDKLMWSKDKRHSCVDFKDFELFSIIGNGTFGKIYLVQRKSHKTFHAMKCIRKDVVIE